MIITDFCTGCRLCEQICPHNAINIKPNSEGFLTAYIDKNICVNCKLCIKKCPQNNEVERKSKEIAFAVRLKDDKLLKRSASGGAFAGFAKRVLLKRGLVAGVVYDENWSAVYKLVDNISELSEMQSSKYLQADTQDIYKQIRQKLNEGRVVLFSGTSCQVAGLKVFLNKDYDNLITVDLICHGVTSPLLFKKYIEWLEDKYHSNLISYNFRSKKIGWGLNYEYRFGNRNYNKPFYVDPYYRIFLSGVAYRECCYRCRYSAVERISDITIGDYWGIKEEHSTFFSRKGVSAIILNTERGLSFFNSIQDDFYSIETKLNKISKHNENLIKPTLRDDNRRNTFYNGINSDIHWFKGIANIYRPTLLSRFKSCIPQSLREYLKNIYRWILKQ